MKIQRYDHSDGCHGCNPFGRMYAEDSGEWVKWEDVVSILKDLNKAISAMDVGLSAIDRYIDRIIEDNVGQSTTKED